MNRALCSICGWRRVYARDRCRSCYRFRMAHGEDKSTARLELESETAQTRVRLARVRRRAELAADAEEVDTA